MVTTKPITTSDSQFTMGHNRSLESSMNRKKRNRKLRKSTYLKIFSSNTFPYSENTSMMSSLLMLSLKIKIYSWRERTLLNCLYTVNMHVYVLYFNLENTCKWILQYTCICSAPRAQGDSKILLTFLFKLNF